MLLRSLVRDSAIPRPGFRARDARARVWIFCFEAEARHLPLHGLPRGAGALVPRGPDSESVREMRSGMRVMG